MKKTNPFSKCKTVKMEELAELCDKYQEVAYNLSYDKTYEDHCMWGLHEALSLLHMYIVDEYDLEDIVKMAKGIYELDTMELDVFEPIYTKMGEFIEKNK